MPVKGLHTETIVDLPAKCENQRCWCACGVRKTPEFKFTFVNVGANMSPQWRDPFKLSSHHRKRVAEDDHCWQEILMIAPRSMTEVEYRDESYRAYDEAIIEYEATRERHGQQIYRVDKRTVVTICDPSRYSIRTCFHEHYGRPHQTGSAAKSGVEKALKYLQTLEDRLNGNVVGELKKLELVKDNLKTKHRTRKSPLVEAVSRIRENYVVGAKSNAVD